jgi:hypothetical protein
MEISCADCGCVVDEGVVLTPCQKYPSCCCGQLPIKGSTPRTDAES